MDWYLQVFSKYADFSGRACRAEFWWFTLYSILVAFGLAIAELIFGLGQVLSLVYSAVVFIPSWAVAVRRLHDTDRSGFWLLIAFVPLLGIIALLIFYIMDGTPGPNSYGPGRVPSSTSISRLQPPSRRIVSKTT